MEMKRFFKVPERSFILLGPRGTGKSTLIKQQLKFDLEINLLKSSSYIQLAANPSLLSQWTAKLKKGSWVYIDEVQKIPQLMDEIHAIYEDQKINFALSSSSARKLVRGGANLMAGRALSFQLFPFLYSEIKDQLTLSEYVNWGTLPQVIVEPTHRKDFLASYIELYLKQELMEEGLLRKLEPFLRFLKVLGIYNGQVLNTENIARESHVGRTTVDKYFEIIEDTLIGYKLNTYNPKWNRKETSHPKFYMFDAGVARACAGLLEDEVDHSWLGYAFENLVINEVRAYNHYLKKKRDLFYYKYTAGYEIDLIIENKKKTLSSPQQVTAIEIKYTKKWDKRWNEPLVDFKQKSQGKVKKIVGVYLGQEILQQGDVEIIPVQNFLMRLSNGEFL